MIRRHTLAVVMLERLVRFQPGLLYIASLPWGRSHVVVVCHFHVALISSAMRLTFSSMWNSKIDGHPRFTVTGEAMLQRTVYHVTPCIRL